MQICQICPGVHVCKFETAWLVEWKERGLGWRQPLGEGLGSRTGGCPPAGLLGNCTAAHTAPQYWWLVGEKQGDRLHQRPSGAADQAEDGRDTTMAICAFSTPLLLVAAASISLVGAQSRFPVASLDYDMILRDVSLTLTFTNIQLLKKLLRQN